MKALALLLLVPALLLAQEPTMDSSISLDTPSEAYQIKQIQLLEQRIERLEKRVEILERAKHHRKRR